jgi:hypothetical protein
MWKIKENQKNKMCQVSLFFFLFLLLFSHLFFPFQPSLLRVLLFILCFLILTSWFLNKLIWIAQISDKHFLVYQIVRSCYELHSKLLQQLKFSTHLSSCGENALRTTLKQTFRASINNVGYCSFVQPTYLPLTYITIKSLYTAKCFGGTAPSSASLYPSV